MTSPTPPIPTQRTATTPGTSCPTFSDSSFVAWQSRNFLQSRRSTKPNKSVVDASEHDIDHKDRSREKRFCDKSYFLCETNRIKAGSENENI